MGGVGRPRKPDRFRMFFCEDSRGSLRPRASLDAVSGLCVDPPRGAMGGCVEAFRPRRVSSRHPARDSRGGVRPDR